MASAAASERGDIGPGWIATTLGVLVLITAGFLAGLLVGIIGQEPELVAGHLAGRSEVVDWSPEPLYPATDAFDSELPAVSASRDFDGLGESEMALPAPEPFVARPQLAAPPAFEASPHYAAPVEAGYAVQVGAFAEGAAAESLAESLSGKGYSAFVTPSAGDAAQRWRVRVGPFSTRENADTIARQLKTREQLPTWVLRQAAG